MVTNSFEPARESLTAAEWSVTPQITPTTEPWTGMVNEA
jgi:hypothetical protein